MSHTKRLAQLSNVEDIPEIISFESHDGSLHSTKKSARKTNKILALSSKIRKTNPSLYSLIAKRSISLWLFVEVFGIAEQELRACSEYLQEKGEMRDE